MRRHSARPSTLPRSLSGLPMAESHEDLSALIKQKTGFSPCKWQVEAIAACRAGKHVIAPAPTGSGKSLPLIAPVMLEKTGILIILSPLNAISE
jgi:ATP-dependent helicase YprA (DUF1998 family)